MATLTLLKESDGGGRLYRDEASGGLLLWVDDRHSLMPIPHSAAVRRFGRFASATSRFVRLAYSDHSNCPNCGHDLGDKAPAGQTHSLPTGDLNVVSPTGDRPLPLAAEGGEWDTIAASSGFQLFRNRADGRLKLRRFRSRGHGGSMGIRDWGDGETERTEDVTPEQVRVLFDFMEDDKLGRGPEYPLPHEDRHWISEAAPGGRFIRLMLA